MRNDKGTQFTARTHMLTPAQGFAIDLDLGLYQNAMTLIHCAHSPVLHSTANCTCLNPCPDVTMSRKGDL